jgi:uncharacterized membrane protein YiaA
MNFNNSGKIAGIILLVIGVVLILLPLWQTYQILNGKAMPPQVFVKPAQQSTQNETITQQADQFLINALPIGELYQILNLMDWLLIMWILMYGGGKLADIGVKLLKD